jgi:hypothetical protein
MRKESVCFFLRVGLKHFPHRPTAGPSPKTHASPSLQGTIPWGEVGRAGHCCASGRCCGAGTGVAAAADDDASDAARGATQRLLNGTEGAAGTAGRFLTADDDPFGGAAEGDAGAEGRQGRGN